jgi:hypothetical protein
MRDINASGISQFAATRRVAVAVLLAVALGSTVAAAQPTPRDCDAIESEHYNDRIDCRIENANVELFEYVDTVIEFDTARREMGRTPIFTGSHIEQMLSGRDRAQSAKTRSHEAQGFRATVKKQKSEDEDCYTKELIGDNKGDDVQPCEMGEDCEEVVGDDIGNEDGVCKLKGANREVCVQVCQQPLLSDMDTYDPEQAADTEKGLIELEDALVDATQQTKLATERMRAAYETRSGSGVNECDVYLFDLAPTATAKQVAQVAKNASGAAFNGCSVVCNQDAFGWNCEAACLALAIVDGVLNAVNDGLSVADGNNGSAQLDRVAKCTTQLDGEISSISGKVDGTQAALDEVNEMLEAVDAKIELLMTLMEERFNVVDNYLCLPQGQRQCFPGGAPTSTGAGAPALGAANPVLGVPDGGLVSASPRGTQGAEVQAVTETEDAAESETGTEPQTRSREPRRRLDRHVDGSSPN